ncbi:MAG: ABC transporter permease, partial [Limisphaerales bacterium]
MDNFLRDLRYGCRILIKSPILTITAILTLGLGIGANTAMFSIVDALILRSLPVNDPKQLVLFGDGRAMGSSGGIPGPNASLFSYSMFRRMQKENHVFANMAAMKSIVLDKHGRVQNAPELEKMRVQLVSGSYFQTLGVVASSGRLFTDDDDKTPGGHPLAVANAAWWLKRFGNESLANGKAVTIGSTVYTIIGIAPQNFFGTTVGDAPNLWIPLSMEAEVSPGWNGLTQNDFRAHHLIARLKSGVSKAAAEAELDAIFKRTLEDFSGPKPSKVEMDLIQKATITLTPAANGLSQTRSKFLKPLNILFSVVALVLLIACANLANLMLARAMARQREITIRLAIGAGRMRLIRQMLTESLLLGILGGGVGALVAVWAGRGVVSMVSGGPTPIPLDASVDLRALAFTSAICLCATVLFGLAPAIKATRMAGPLDLKEGKGAVSNRGHQMWGSALLVGQVAISLMLLVGAGLFLRALTNLTDTDMGFEKRNVLLFSPDFSSANYKEDKRLSLLYDQIEQEVSALPGIEAASFSAFTFNQGAWTDAISTAKVQVTPNSPYVNHNVIGTGYFTTMGIPLLEGRGFTSQDTANAKKVAVVNETFARRYFPNVSPIGQHFQLSGSADDDREIIGLVKDAKYQSVQEKTQPAAYYPRSQRVQFFGDFEVRYRGDEGAAATVVRKVFARIDNNIPITNVRTMTEEIDRSILDQRLLAQLCGGFAMLALFLACVG